MTRKTVHGHHIPGPRLTAPGAALLAVLLALPVGGLLWLLG